MKKLLDINEVGDLLQLSIHTIYHQRHRREGVGALGINLGGRHGRLRWREADIERWLDEQEENVRESVG